MSVASKVRFRPPVFFLKLFRPGQRWWCAFVAVVVRESYLLIHSHRTAPTATTGPPLPTTLTCPLCLVWARAHRTGSSSSYMANVAAVIEPVRPPRYAYLPLLPTAAR